MDSSVVDKHALHLEIRGLACALVVELDEGVLQAVPRLLVADDLARQDLAEAAEDELEVRVRGHRVEFAHEEHVFRRFDFGEREVAHHF